MTDCLAGVNFIFFLNVQYYSCYANNIKLNILLGYSVWVLSYQVRDYFSKPCLNPILAMMLRIQYYPDIAFSFILKLY